MVPLPGVSTVQHVERCFQAGYGWRNAVVSGELIPGNSVLVVFADGRHPYDRQIVQCTDKVRIGLDELNTFWKQKTKELLGVIP